jgi:hypothetical protein
MNRDTGQQEGFTALNISEPGSTTTPPGLIEEYKRQSESGANWFFWVAALSLINSIIVLFEGQWSFLAGLAVTQVIDGLAISLAEQLGGAANVVAIILDAMVAGIFVVFGLLARRGLIWAFVLGMVIYTLDGLVFLLVQDWLPIAFHVFVLYSLYRGLAALRKLKALEAESSAVGA